MGKKEESFGPDSDLRVIFVTMSFGNFRGKVVQNLCTNTKYGILVYF